MFPFRPNSILHPPHMRMLLVYIGSLGLYTATNAGKNRVKAKTIAPNQPRLRRQASEGTMIPALKLNKWNKRGTETLNFGTKSLVTLSMELEPRQIPLLWWDVHLE